MPGDERKETEVFVCAGPRTPFAKIDGPLAHLDAVSASVPVVRAVQASLKDGVAPDSVVWGTVIPTLAVSHIAREIWLDAGLDPHVPALTVVQQCATSLAAATHGGDARSGTDDERCDGPGTLRRIGVAVTNAGGTIARHEQNSETRRLVEGAGSGAQGDRGLPAA
jgi:hypothetical protein